MEDDDLPRRIDPAVKLVVFLLGVRRAVKNAPGFATIFGHGIKSPSLLRSGTLAVAR
jgi:hypothetical protein